MTVSRKEKNMPTPHDAAFRAFMAFRMLRYAVAAMQRHFEQHHELSLVIPLLFYHGERSRIRTA